MSAYNILLITTDQHRRDSLGVYGSRVCRTPNLDHLGQKGLIFTHAFTPTAICTPGRASLLTGVWPHRHLLLANIERNQGFRTELGDEYPPFSRYLRERGYRCANVGKWHIGDQKGPEAFGFEGMHYRGWAPAYDHPDYLRYIRERGIPRFGCTEEIRGVFPNGAPGISMAGIYGGPVEGTFPHFLAERTIDRLREYTTTQPFFLACNFYGPHLPYYLPRAYADMYDPEQVELPESMKETFENKPQVQRNYADYWAFESFTSDQWRKLIAMYWGGVTLIDEQIGRILRALDELDLTERTVVFFAADHGAFVGGHRLSDKGPAMYDDIYRIPMLAYHPGLPERGRAPSNFVSLLDLTPTFLDIAGAPIPEVFDGRSLLPLLRDEDPPDWPEEVFAQFHGHQFPYPQRMIRTRTHKLVVSPGNVNELYDLDRDPNELMNRYDDPGYRGIRRNLSTRLYRHLKANDDNFYHWMAGTCEIDEALADPSLMTTRITRNA